MTAALVALSQLYTHLPSSFLSVLPAVTLAGFPPDVPQRGSAGAEAAGSAPGPPCSGAPSAVPEPPRPAGIAAPGARGKGNTTSAPVSDPADWKELAVVPTEVHSGG